VFKEACLLKDYTRNGKSIKVILKLRFSVLIIFHFGERKMSSSIIVNSNGSFFKLSTDGVLEEIPLEEDNNSIGTQRVGLSQNPASSNSTAVPPKINHGELITGLVGMDVHGTRMFLRARV
jgi:hypothetical protein